MQLSEVRSQRFIIVLLCVTGVIISGDYIWTQMTLTLDNFDLEAGTDVDVMQAVRYAAQLPFRAGVSKTMILLACSECTERQQRYSDVQRLLLNNDIHLHVLVHEILRLKSRSPKTAYIYGKSSLHIE